MGLQNTGDGRPNPAVVGSGLQLTFAGAAFKLSPSWGSGLPPAASELV
jgi:hypothetical protein